MKFSIIIPAYNVEKYIEKCLDSVLNQTYSNYEVIVINDGSIDATESLILPYLNNDKIKYIIQKNKGISNARNRGLQEVTGEYILFLDSDDYINKDLLRKLDEEIKKSNSEIIKFNNSIVSDDYKLISETKNYLYSGMSSKSAVNMIIKDYYTETVWAYAYKTSFWKQNNFIFREGYVNEDFELSLKIFSKAKTFSSIEYCGYNYVQRSSSIMHLKNYEKTYQNVYNFYSHYEEHKKCFNNSKIDKLLLSYSAESTIYKGRELNDEDLKEYIKFIKKNKVFDDIYVSSFKKFFKKAYIKLFINKYYSNIRG